MRHLCMTALAPLVLCTATFAADQISTTKASSDKMKVIPTLGYTYYNIQGSNADFKAKGGSSVAALFQLPLNDNLVLETGLEYFEAAAKISETLGQFDLDYAYINLDHLAIPLRVIYSLNQPAVEGVRWFAKGGLTPSYVMSAKFQTASGTEDIKTEVESLNYLAHLGFGADWQVSLGGRITADITYNYALNKYSKSDEGRIAGIQLQAGYAIEL